MWLWLEGVTRFRGLRHPDEWWERHGGGPALSLSQCRWDELTRLWRWLWSRHLATLTTLERREFEAHKHPSHNPDDPRNQSVLAEFRERMRHVRCIRQIHVSLYHGDRMILDAELREQIAPHIYRREIPGFFRGYEVRVFGPPASSPAAGRLGESGAQS